MPMPLTIESPIENWQTFEAQYLRVREKEGRVLSDEALQTLPKFYGEKSLQREWKMRGKSMKILLQKLPKSNTILDLGCGNGWMTAQLQKAGFSATGVDVNLPELEQAARVFPAVDFVFADIFQWQTERKFDTVLLSSALQYFASPNELFKRLFKLFPNLKNVVIHDTPFYKNEEKHAAALRSKKYYASLDAPKMAENYHHHSFFDLQHQWQYLYKPSKFGRMMGKPIFPCIEIKNAAVGQHV